MLAVLFLRALLDLNFWYAHLLAPAVVLLGLGDLRGWSWQRTHARAVVAAALAIAALVLLSTLRDYRGMAVIWTQSLPTGEMDERLAAARRNPFLTALVDSVVADATPVDARSGRPQLALNSRSMWWRPTPRMVWRQSALLAVNGYGREACEVLSRALRIYPHRERAFRTFLQAPNTSSLAALQGLRDQLDALAAGVPAERLCRSGNGDRLDASSGRVPGGRVRNRAEREGVLQGDLVTVADKERKVEVHATSGKIVEDNEEIYQIGEEWAVIGYRCAAAGKSFGMPSNTGFRRTSRVLLYSTWRPWARSRLRTICIPARRPRCPLLLYPSCLPGDRWLDRRNRLAHQPTQTWHTNRTLSADEETLARSRGA
jgi:hypothetical protein